MIQYEETRNIANTSILENHIFFKAVTHQHIWKVTGKPVLHTPKVPKVPLWLPVLPT